MSVSNNSRSVGLGLLVLVYSTILIFLFKFLRCMNIHFDWIFLISGVGHSINES